MLRPTTPAYTRGYCILDIENTPQDIALPYKSPSTEKLGENASSLDLHSCPETCEVQGGAKGRRGFCNQGENREAFMKEILTYLIQFCACILFMLVEGGLINYFPGSNG